MRVSFKYISSAFLGSIASLSIAACTTDQLPLASVVSSAETQQGVASSGGSSGGAGISGITSGGTTSGGTTSGGGTVTSGGTTSGGGTTSTGGTAPTLTFTANGQATSQSSPAVVTAGANITYNWSASANAVKFLVFVTAVPSGSSCGAYVGQELTGLETASGPVTLPAPTCTGLYEITMTDSNSTSQSISQNVYVQVNAATGGTAPSLTFTANGQATSQTSPAVVTAGANITYSWSASANATVFSTTITAVPSGSSCGAYVGQILSGLETVSGTSTLPAPTCTGLYEITMKDSNGTGSTSQSVSQSVYVQVNAATGGTTGGGTSTGGGALSCAIAINPKSGANLSSGVFDVGQSATFTITLANPQSGTSYYGCLAGDSGASPNPTTPDFPATPQGCANPQPITNVNGTWTYSLPVTFAASDLKGLQAYYYSRTGVVYSVSSNGTATSADLCPSSTNSVEIEVANTQSTLTIGNSSNPNLGNVYGIVVGDTTQTKIINCGSAPGVTGSVCTAQVGSNTQVVLTATANTGEKLAGWTGATCTNATANTCTVTISGSATETATFTQAQGSLPAASAESAGAYQGNYYVSMYFNPGLAQGVTAPTATLTCGNQTPISMTAAPNQNSQTQINYIANASSFLPMLGSSCSIQAFSAATSAIPATPVSLPATFALAPEIAADGVTSIPGYVELYGAYYENTPAQIQVLYNCAGITPALASIQYSGPTQINVVAPASSNACSYTVTIWYSAGTPFSSVPVSYTIPSN